MNNTLEIASHPQPHCPLCGYEGDVYLEQIVDTIYNNRGKWDLRECKNAKCGLFWLDPRPLKEEIWKAYQEYYTHTDSKANIFSFLRFFEECYVDTKYHYPSKQNPLKKWFGSLLFYVFPTEKAEVDMRYFYLQNSADKKLLDVGCGDGSLMERLANKGWNVQGIDFDEKAIDFCKSRGLRASVGDLLSMNYPDASFDVVTLNHVIEHLFDTQKVVEECYRILRPGGSVIIATPNTHSRLFRRKFKRSWFSLHTPAHIQLFNRDCLKNSMEAIGFKVDFSKSTMRNEHWVYACSKIIRKNGKIAYGKEKPNKFLLLRGKIVQLFTAFYLVFNQDIGSEVVIKATKN